MTQTHDDELTFDDIARRHVTPIARRVAYKYRGYVEVEDVRQTMLEWLHSTGEKPVRKWLKKSEPHRIFRALNGIAANYARTEKAQSLGYSPDDEFFYSPQVVEALLPLALDPTFDGQGELDVERMEKDRTQRGRKAPNERGDLAAQVLDVRLGLGRAPHWCRDTLIARDDSVDSWATAVQALIEVLGGERPWQGRKAKSNAQSHHEASTEYDGG